MIKDAAVDSTEGAGCQLQSAAVQSAVRTAMAVLPSHFQISTNSAAVTRLFHSAGTAGAAMDPAEGAGCRCIVPRCREPCMQQWILQKVQGAAAEYRGAGSRACNNGSCRGCFCWTLPCRMPWVRRKIRALQTADLVPQGSVFFACHMRRSYSLSRRHSWPSNSAIQKSSTNIFLHSACVSNVCMGLWESTGWSF